MTTPLKKTILHGSAIILGDAGVLLRGAAGAGKSDLAFRLMEEHGAVLVSDDQVEITRRDGRLFAGGVDAIRGMIEVRGIGLLHVPAVASAVVRLVIDLSPRESVPRMPDWGTVDILDVPVPALRLYPFDASTPLKIRKAAEVLHNADLLVK